MTQTARIETGLILCGCGVVLLENDGNGGQFNYNYIRCFHIKDVASLLPVPWKQFRWQ